MFLSAANNLENNKKMVDDLNVFPVPDGDTGTNMSMTVSAAARQVPAVEENSVSKVAECIASASLRGARGNSGVISSQLFRGFYKGLNKLDEVNTVQIAEAFKSANETAYKAVMKPTEGTILTVSRETAEYASNIAAKTEDIIEFAEKVAEYAKEVLNKTPDMLPVLKQAGVVDAGGMGLCVLLDGCLMALKGQEVELVEKPSAPVKTSFVSTEIDTANIKFMYCTEFIINKKSTNYSVSSFRAAIQNKGDCMLVIEDDDIVKVHIHTNHPGFVLEQAVKIGELTNLKIDNMKYQHNEITPELAANKVSSEPPKEYGMVAVAAGEGMTNILKELGVDKIVEGGQSMNPSTEDILKEVESVNAKTVFVFPNNKNIILAAEQVDELTEKEVRVIPSKTIPQGISAILSFDESTGVEENTDTMTDAISLVKTASVTFAARDSEIDGMTIKKDDIMGMEEGKISALGKNPSDVVMELLEKMVTPDISMISIFYGSDVSENDVSELEKTIKSTYPKLDCLINNGGQPLYYYIISLE
ncbi:MAG: DAK2 domain-containing protein [Clostridia bacterium]|nr:DAK2 domain-containing protein [Clostridia bacterium]